MNIVHLLPGRLRVRLPELQSAEFSRKLTALLSQDERITDLWVTNGCYSLTLYYDPLKITVPEIMALLRMPNDSAAGAQPLAMQAEGRSAGESALTMDEAEIREVASTQEAGQVADWESPGAGGPVVPATGGEEPETLRPEEADSLQEDQELSLDQALEEAQGDVQEEAPPARKPRKKSTKEGDKTDGQSKRPKKSNKMP